LVEQLSLPKEKGRIVVNPFFEVEGHASVWALGDCVTMAQGTSSNICAPTAQCATRAAKTLARNLKARLQGLAPVPFTFKGLGKMGSLGHRSAVAQLFNRVHLSGMLAWFMWRTVYWWKLPGIDRKIRVGISWLLDLLLPPDTVQLKTGAVQAVSQLHYEPGEEVFREGDLGDTFYIILGGEAEVVASEQGTERVLAKVRAGEYFGEMALLNRRTRSATVRCVLAMCVLAVRQKDFYALVGNLPDLRKSFERVMQSRIDADRGNASDD